MKNSFQALAIFFAMPLTLAAQQVSYLSMPYPATSYTASALGVTADRVVGRAAALGDGWHAMIWSHTGAIIADLNPPGVSTAYALATTDTQQVGSIATATTFHAALWSGSAASFIDLHPAEATLSHAYAISGNQQAGYAIIGGNRHAAIWSGTASSFVDLHPTGAQNSQLTATTGSQQVGYVDGHAGLWSGTPASFVDLNPPGYSSLAYGMAGNRQVGWVNSDAFSHAAIWAGSASSFIDLNPPGIAHSYLRATTGEYHAGQIRIGSEYHAALWLGSADSVIDLDVILGNAYGNSNVEAIWTDGETIKVVGDAWHLGTQTYLAIVWTVTALPPVPDPDSDGDGVPDDEDACPHTPIGAIVNASGCSIDQLVPREGPASGGVWRNHGEYFAARVKVIQQFRREGRLNQKQFQALIAESFRRINRAR